jgi:predicted phage tail protein
MGRRAGLWSILPLLGVVLACALAPAAKASTIYLRPDGTTVVGAWYTKTNPTPTSLHLPVNEPIVQPAQQGTEDDHIGANVDGPAPAELSLATYPLRLGENVLSATAWADVHSASARSLDLELRTGGTSLASYTVLSGAPFGWYSTGHFGLLTQLQLDDLRMRFTLQGPGPSTEVRVRTAYVELNTDMAPPQPAITSSPLSPGAGRSPSWSFTGTGMTGFECRLERAGTAVFDWAACTSAKAYDLTGHPDGAYTFLVRSRDAGGLRSTAASSTYQLDTTAPVAPAITGAPASPSNATSPSWSFTAEAGSTTQCQLERGVTVVSAWAACASPHGYNLSAEVDGTYTFRVRATDAAGNVGAEATSTYTLDRAAPAPPTIVSGPTGSSANAAPSYGFTSEVGATFACRLERAGSPVSDWSSCTSPRAYDLSGEPDAAYTFRVRATDAAGNTSADATRTYTLDRAAPAAPSITAGPPAATSNATASYSFTAEAGAAFACRIERGATVVDDWAPCVSGRSYDLSLEADGTYTFSVRATDAAGNTGPAATRVHDLDRAAPAAPSVTSGPSGPTNGPAPSFGFTAEAGATTECRLERGVTTVSAWSACTSPRAYDLSGEPDGAYVLSVRATDAAGNIGSVGTRSFTLDRVAPSAPAITAAPAADTADGTPTWSFTADAGTAAECRIERGGVVVGDWAPCASPETADLSAQPDGAYTFRVRSVDAAGNTGPEDTSSFALDRAAPAPPSISAGPAAASSDATPEWTFSAEAGASTACRLERGDGTAVEDWAPCASPRGYDVTAEADGDLTFRVRATDAAGNTSADATRTYTLDRAAPAAPAITTGPAAESNDDTPTYDFTGEAGASASCRTQRGAAVVADWAPCSSPATLDLSAQPDGAYTFLVRLTDPAGNTGAAAMSSYTLDRTAPSGPAITGGPTGDSSDAQPAWSFTVEAGSSPACRLERGATVVSDWAPCVSPRSYDLTLQPDGAYTFRVRTTDAAGNTGAEASAGYVLDRAAPAAPTISAGPAADSADDTPEWTFAGEPGTTPACRLERGAATVSDWGPCSSPAGYDLTGQPDATYTFRVRTTDAAGNVGAIASASYALDRAAPAAPVIVSSPADDSADDTPTWSFTAEAGAATTCRLERGMAVVADWGPCADPRTYDLSAAVDGEYTFRVRATDAAGNTGTSAMDLYRLDRAAPAAPAIASGPASITSDATAAYQFTHEAGAAATCRLERGAAVVADWAPCASPRTHDLSAQPDGTYTFRVRATDAAGNTGPEATWTHTLDRAAPAAPVLTSAPPPAGSGTSPSWSFTAEAGAVVTCRLQRGATVVSDWVACASPRAYDLAAEVDGTYTFRVRATDAAGNTGPEATGTYALDRVAPAAPSISSGPTGASQNAAPSYAFTAEALAATQCRMERGATVVSDWSACTSPRSYDLALQPDGAYTFRVRAVDQAGNVGADATRTYTLDRAAPAAPSITGAPASESADAAPSYSFTAEPGAATACRIERGATVVSDWTPCSTPTGYDLTAQADGLYTFSVRATDAAGNTGPAATHAYELDRVAPNQPTITARPPAVTNDATPEWTWTGDADSSAFTCRLTSGAATIYTFSSCSTPKQYDLSGLPDGTYTFRVRASDPAANISTEANDTFSLDRQPPPAPAITGAPAADSPDDTPTYSFSAEAGATTHCRIERGGTPFSDWSPCTSPRTYDLTAEPDGAYTFRVRAVDQAGNVGAEATHDYALDRGAPAAPSITAAPPGDSADDTPSYAFTAEAGATASCRLERGAAVVSDWAACASPRSYDLAGDPDGTYTFRVRAIDAAGNTGPDASRSYTLDRQAPAAPSIDGAPPADSPDATPAWSFTAEAGAALECRVQRGAAVVSDWASCTSPQTYDLSAEPDGAYTFRVRATDAAGNTGPDAGRTYTLDRSAPAAPSIASGPPADSPDDVPEYGFTTEPGATTACRLERGAAVVSDWSACASPRAYDLSGEVDGTYTFRVRATDAAGNTGPDATRSYALDRVAPAAPDIASGPVPDSTDDTPTYDFSAEPGAAVECRLEPGATAASDWSPCTSPRTYDLSGEVDGTYTFRVRATDAAGNTGADATHAYTLDRTVPHAPVLDARPGDDGNDRTPEWAFSTPEPNKTFECRLARGATVLSAWGSCASPREYDLTLEPDATYDFEVRAVNAAGTRSLATVDAYRLDTAAPAAPAVSGGPAPDSTDDSPEWTIAAEPGAALECRLDRGATVVSDWAACSTPHGYDLSGEVDGTYRFRTRATDAAGNTGPEGSVSYALDRTVPLAPALGANPPAAGSDPTPTWEFAGEPGKTFECRLTRGGDVVSDWAPCTSPHTPDLTADPDGTYTVEIRAVNPAGTRSPVTSDEYALDRVTPAAPVIVGGPAADSADGTPTWSFTGEPAAAFECRIERGATVVGDWAACTDPETSDLDGEPDATYTFRVRQTDRAGNTSPDASRSYNLDRTIPGAPSIDAQPVSPGFDQTPEWEISGTAGLTLECRLARAGAAVAGWAPCTSPRTYDLTAEPDGAYRLHVRQFNAAGTRGPEVTGDYLLDATAPSPPDVTGTPGAVGNGSDPAWSFVAEPGASVECRLDRGPVEVRPWAPCTSPRAFRLAGEPDGDYTFSVRATDAAGNTGAPARTDHRLDRVPPAPPAIRDDPGSLGRDRTPAWAFEAEAGATFECTLERAGGVLDPWAVCASPRGYDLAGQDDGAFAFGVRARDAAGNTSPVASSPYLLDTTPGAVTIEGGPGPRGRDRAPAWRFSAEAGASFECRLSLRDVPVADWGPCVSPHGFDLAGRPDGVFAFALRATDEAGNVGPPGQATYELDTTPPPAPSIERRPDSPGEDRTPTWRFTGEQDATFTCRVDREPSGVVLDWTLCASPFTADLVGSEDGRHRLMVRATDLAGNTGEAACNSSISASRRGSSGARVCARRSAPTWMPSTPATSMASTT